LAETCKVLSLDGRGPRGFIRRHFTGMLR
jgi:hypothetical protein